MKNTKGIPSSEAGWGEPSKALRSLCIVVADDDRDAVLTLTMVLRHEGHEVLAAFHGQQVLDAVLKNDTDVVLLDIVLPDLSGYEVARKIIARHGEQRPNDHRHPRQIQKGGLTEFSLKLSASIITCRSRTCRAKFFVWDHTARHYASHPTRRAEELSHRVRQPSVLAHDGQQ